jgi:hypothetical protein
MKSILVTTVCAFGVVGVLLSTIATVLHRQKAVQAAYRRGWSEATLQMQQEAVREGHARWRRGEDGKVAGIEWNPRRSPLYTPDRPATQRIDELLPDPPEPVLTRLLQ